MLSLRVLVVALLPFGLAASDCSQNASCAEVESDSSGNLLTVKSGKASVNPADGSKYHCRPMGTDGKPTGLQHRVRKEVSKMSNAEFKQFSKAMNKLKSAKARCNKGDGRCLDNYPRTYDAFAAVHPKAHLNEDEFFVMHRRMLYDLETQLQMIMKDCDITIPFWNSYREAGSPQDSNVWNKNRYGSLDSGSWCSGGGPSANCIEDGIAGGWPKDKRAPYNSCDACPFRSPERWANIATLPVVMAGLKKKRSFEQFQTWAEGVHIPVHQWIGGDMGNVPFNTFDPVFFAHHGMTDRMLHWWQVYNEYATGIQGYECRTCNGRMTFFGDRRKEWMGDYNEKGDCMQYPLSNPTVCVSYDGVMQTAREAYKKEKVPADSRRRGGNRWQDDRRRRQKWGRSKGRDDDRGWGNDDGWDNDNDGGRGWLLQEDSNEDEVPAEAKPSKESCEDTLDNIDELFDDANCTTEKMYSQVKLTISFNKTAAQESCRKFWSTMLDSEDHNTTKDVVDHKIADCVAVQAELSETHEQFGTAESKSTSETAAGIQCGVKLSC